jgi:hypothetical protein
MFSNAFALSITAKRIIAATLFVGGCYLIYDGMRNVEYAKEPVYRVDYTYLWTGKNWYLWEHNSKIVGYNPLYKNNEPALALVGAACVIYGLAFIPSFDGNTAKLLYRCKF